MADKRAPVVATAVACSACLVTGWAATPSEAPVQAPGPLAPLAGTWMKSGKPDAPLLLIIPGSGPTDRDGNNPGGIKAASYRLLAQGLAARGIDTVRIDKRGLFGSAAAVANPNAVTIGDYAQDVASWVKTWRAATGAPCIWVAGHSEGGLVALAAGQGAPGICGLVLLSTAGRPLGQVLREQLQRNVPDKSQLEVAMSAIDTLEAGRRVDTTGMSPMWAPVFRPAVQGYLIDAFALDPARLIAEAKHPVLILQGERDLQVGVADAERLHRAAPASTLVLLPDTNHVLKTVASDDRAANLAAYADPDLPLAPGVVDAVADFVNATRPAPN